MEAFRNFLINLILIYPKEKKNHWGRQRFHFDWTNQTFSKLNRKFHFTPPDDEVLAPPLFMELQFGVLGDPLIDKQVSSIWTVEALVIYVTNDSDTSALIVERVSIRGSPSTCVQQQQKWSLTSPQWPHPFHRLFANCKLLWNSFLDQFKPSTQTRKCRKPIPWHEFVSSCLIKSFHSICRCLHPSMTWIL